jgi:hypothetical protein
MQDIDLMHFRVSFFTRHNCRLQLHDIDLILFQVSDFTRHNCRVQLHKYDPTVGVPTQVYDSTRHSGATDVDMPLWVPMIDIPRAAQQEAHLIAC